MKILNSITELSRFFPYSESRFMRELEVSREFENWCEAFEFDFDSLDANLLPIPRHAY